jgi:hypothetical protein
VHDLIFGNFWAEIYGKVKVICKKTGGDELG